EIFLYPDTDITVHRTVMDSQLSCKLWICRKQNLIPHFCLAAGIGKDQCSFTCENDGDDLIHEFCSQLICPWKYLYIITNIKMNFVFRYFAGTYFGLFQVVENKRLHSLIQVDDCSCNPPNPKFLTVTCNPAKRQLRHYSTFSTQKFMPLVHYDTV